MNGYMAAVQYGMRVGGECPPLSQEALDELFNTQIWAVYSEYLYQDLYRGFLEGVKQIREGLSSVLDE